MNPWLLIGGAALIGYSRARAKRKKLTSALLWGAGAWLALNKGPALLRGLPSGA